MKYLTKNGASKYSNYRRLTKSKNNKVIKNLIMRRLITF